MSVGYFRKQDAQLSQTDRAAACVSLGQSGRLQLGDNIFCG